MTIKSVVFRKVDSRYLEIYSLVQDGIIEPELGAKRLNMTFADFERAMQKAGCKL